MTTSKHRNTIHGTRHALAAVCVLLIGAPLVGAEPASKVTVRPAGLGESESHSQSAQTIRHTSATGFSLTDVPLTPSDPKTIYLRNVASFIETGNKPERRELRIAPIDMFAEQKQTSSRRSAANDEPPPAEVTKAAPREPAPREIARSSEPRKQSIIQFAPPRPINLPPAPRVVETPPTQAPAKARNVEPPSTQTPPAPNQVENPLAQVKQSPSTTGSSITQIKPAKRQDQVSPTQRQPLVRSVEAPRTNSETVAHRIEERPTQSQPVVRRIEDDPTNSEPVTRHVEAAPTHRQPVVRSVEPVPPQHASVVRQADTRPAPTQRQPVVRQVETPPAQARPAVTQTETLAKQRQPALAIVQPAERSTVADNPFSPAQQSEPANTEKRPSAIVQFAAPPSAKLLPAPPKQGQPSPREELPRIAITTRPAPANQSSVTSPAPAKRAASGLIQFVPPQQQPGASTRTTESPRAAEPETLDASASRQTSERTTPSRQPTVQLATPPKSAQRVPATNAMPLATEQIRNDNSQSLTKPASHSAAAAVEKHVEQPRRAAQPRPGLLVFVQPPAELPAQEPAQPAEQQPSESQDATEAEEIDPEFRPIGSVGINIAPPGDLLPDSPADKRFENAGEQLQPTGASRPWSMYAFTWEAPAVSYRPLYFEDVNLERYGFSYGAAQPFLSAAHFFSRVPVIPYMRGADSPRHCVYTLGYYRPGSCVPYNYHRLPISVKGALMEAGTVVGSIYLVP